MRILFTGASSFTGFWFAKTIAEGGHQIVAPLRGMSDFSGADDRSKRLRALSGKMEIVGQCAFGSPRFIQLISQGNWDLLCHHAAEVGDYRDPDYDIARAVAANTHNLRLVLSILAERGAQGVVLTGSFFENGEGAGNEPRSAFSPYGVSKSLTATIAEYRCHEIGIRYGKFVIPNPFGPYEQPRLGAYLAKTWKANGVAEIKTPLYVRDNIHVDLLAYAYRRFCEETPSAPDFRRLNPSGYVETQGAFVKRVAAEIGARTQWECGVRFAQQSEFPEPFARLNTHPATQFVQEWEEKRAWNDYADWFLKST